MKFVSYLDKSREMKVPPRFELGSLDSKSRVLTITPWDHTDAKVEKREVKKTVAWEFEREVQIHSNSTERLISNCQMVAA